MALYSTIGKLSCRKLKEIRYISFTSIYQKWNSKQDNDDDKLLPDTNLERPFLSIYERGYLRSLKPYSPPKNVSSIISKICENFNFQEGGVFVDRQMKFNVLKECFKALDHSVPNSILHKINNIDDVQMFYHTPISTTVPLDKMKNVDLPKNLHVLYEYVRFHPETDTKFGGISAYPESSTVMTDLRAKKKYPGYDAKKKNYEY